MTDTQATIAIDTVRAMHPQALAITISINDRLPSCHVIESHNWPLRRLGSGGTIREAWECAAMEISGKQGEGMPA